MSSIELIIFDMDGVLCHYDFDRRLAILSDVTVQEAGKIDAAIFRSGFDDQGDRGLLSSDDYLQQFGERLGAPVSRAEWLRARRESMSPDHEVLNLVRRLQEQVGVAMLTNNGPVLQEGFAEVFPEAAALFGDRAFFSSQLRSTKEVPEIFRLLLARLGVDPAATLFIDDTASYITAARVAGLQTHHYSRLDSLIHELRQLGLRPD